MVAAVLAPDAVRKANVKPCDVSGLLAIRAKPDYILVSRVIIWPPIGRLLLVAGIDTSVHDT